MTSLFPRTQVLYCSGIGNSMGSCSPSTGTNTFISLDLDVTISVLTASLDKYNWIPVFYVSTLYKILKWKKKWCTRGLVNGNRRGSASDLNLNRGSVDDLNTGDDAFNNDSCTFASINGNRVNLALDLNNRVGESEDVDGVAGLSLADHDVLLVSEVLNHPLVSLKGKLGGLGLFK